MDATFAASGAGVEPKVRVRRRRRRRVPTAVAGVVRMEHVAHARASAARRRRRARSLFRRTVRVFPFFYSRVFEQKDSARKVAWVFYGVAEGETIVVGDFAPKLAAFWIDGGRVVGGMLESGAPEENAAVEAAAKARKVVDVEALRACATEKGGEDGRGRVKGRARAGPEAGCEGGKGETRRGEPTGTSKRTSVYFLRGRSHVDTWVSSLLPSWTVHIERSDGCGGTGDELNDELKPRRFTIRSVPASSADGFPGPPTAPGRTGRALERL